jgi:hypothetical protein
LAVIGIFWMSHHRLFGYFQTIDDTTTLLNLVVLMAMAALPFASAVIGRYGHQRAAVILYTASMAVAGTLMVSLWVVADRRICYRTGPPNGRSMPDPGAEGQPRWTLLCRSHRRRWRPGSRRISGSSC